MKDKIVVDESEFFDIVTCNRGSFLKKNIIDQFQPTTDCVNWLLFGAGGHSKVILDILVDLDGQQEVIIFDDNARTQDRKPPKILPAIPVLHGIGDLRVRKELQIERYPDSSWPSIIATTSHVANTAVVCCGAQILHYVYVGPETIIGRGCIINNHASVDHGCDIGEFCHVAPGTILCGGIKVGPGTLIGAGTVVLPDITIGENCIIAAGSRVDKDIPRNSVLTADGNVYLRRSIVRENHEARSRTGF